MLCGVFEQVLQVQFPSWHLWMSICYCVLGHYCTMFAFNFWPVMFALLQKWISSSWNFCWNHSKDLLDGPIQMGSTFILIPSPVVPRLALLRKVPLCDTNIGTRDRSFLLEIRCLSHLLWLNRNIFLIGTNGIQKFGNLAYSHNFFKFLIAL